MTGDSGNSGSAQHRPLKLKARDEEDLDVIGALLQDALVPLMDSAYLPSEKRFVMVVNRFLWSEAQRANAPSQPPALPEGADAAFEDAAEEPPFGRVNCGVCFDKVTAVRSRGFDKNQKDEILNFLTLKAEPGLISLFFSEGAVIQLVISRIACHLEDLGEVWPTRWRPDHDAALEAETEDPAPDGA